MKQKVVVKAVITQGDKILLLRRKGGRPSISGMYELPGGRVHIKQQPEDALAHALRIHMSTSFETARLDDVMTFIDPDDRALQYLFVIYKASLKPTDKNINLSSEYDKYIWKKMSEIQQDMATASTMQILGLTPLPFATGASPSVYLHSDDKIATKNIIAYSDGGSRGNPGPSAAGFVLFNNSGVLLSEGGAYLGYTTNNIAEYEALYLGLQKALELGAQTVDFRLDSQLVVNQMNGLYKVKNIELRPVHYRIEELARQFSRVTYTHIFRESNQLADGVVNKILDQQTI